MKAVVCVKTINNEINPFDESALECALSIENAEITVISMGKLSTVNILKGLTRLGVKRVILLTDHVFAGADTLATSYVLSLAVQKLNPDLIICGRQSVDGDTAQVGPCLAQMLNIPQITNVLKIRAIDSKISCTSRVGAESVKLPALITVERVNTLRFPSIRAITGEVEVWNARDLGADIHKCGLKGSPTKVLRTYECNTGQRKCKFIRSSELMKIIEYEKMQTKEQITYKPVEKKFDEIWIVGEQPKEIALSIAEKVIIIDKKLPEEIAALAQRHKPKVILWNSDLWGRSNAPRVAALLQTGLCADCTSLETDGEKLYMYRPTFGGSLMAKIECVTLPQMATVRTTVNTQEEIIVAGGKGAKDDLEFLKEFSIRIGASLGASRALVDLGLVPYSKQIGLTGKSVNPKIYIACGISGSLQHTCAVEQAQTIIAINKDKNARIFEYADYGIIGEIKEVINVGLNGGKSDYRIKELYFDSKHKYIGC